MTTENKKIFSPKIIIGSIMSFIATVLGIVAVFFPDLLNLQKNRIKEYSIFIYDKSDVAGLYNFLDKNRESVINLKIAYCSTGFNGAFEFEEAYEETEEIIRREDGNSPYVLVSGKVIEEGGIAATRNEGHFEFLDFGEILPINNFMLFVNKKSDENKSYAHYWEYNGAEYDKEYEQYREKCNIIPGSKWRDDAPPSIGLLSGTFYLTSGPAIDSVYTLALEPLTQAELKLKNY
ncbi:hypothetical protein BKK51_07025 [Rodentibacter trehalosifermentans]|uniref:Uncharacterized protein n=2 Tax=Rodentibacter TaxID=1960084 RepID=A0A1V3IQA5_9PAST|nr:MULTISPECIES: hypothetical protein [Rodentibacter]OOF37927.1 hypothetical protein BKK49_10815 [Rodentibacter rarus]OOF44124.1 hypothetical protein BKK50_03290 [Rodentibacter rarus]OOF45297.1 hypothetical protein BKK51_07025 [Rodentibacter trehalosifermentans]